MAFECTLHVNAMVAIKDGEPIIDAFIVSDWFNVGSTVRIYTNGKCHD